MIKGIFIAAMVLLVAWELDRHFTHGKYTDALLAMSRQIRHSFG